MRITFVLWRGDIGGAERVTVALAGELRRMGVDANVLFICDPGLLRPQMTQESVPYAALGHHRGSQVLAHPLALRRNLHELRPDAVIAVSVGYLGAAIRAAGFRGPIIGVEHGALRIITEGRRVARVKRWIDRRVGVGAYDVEVAISEFMMRLVRRAPHARRVTQIPHGVAVPASTPRSPRADPDELVVGFAGRLVPGKGLDRLIQAVSLLRRSEPARSVLVRVVGDGDMRPAWEALARELGVGERVRFLGWSDDIPGHWARCDVAVALSDTFLESFGMSVLEAMAAGRAAIVTDRGALHELVVPGVTGEVVTAGDEAGLAAALARYASDRQTLHAHGAAARARAATEYSLSRSAERYLDLATELAGASTNARAPFAAGPQGRQRRRSRGSTRSE